MAPDFESRHSRLVAQWAAIAVLVVLTACTSVKFEGQERRLPISPGNMTSATANMGGTVVWGGRIMAIRNFEDGAEFEVLALPLDSGNRPRTSQPSQGRFIAFYPGFLEPGDYKPGRHVSLAGQLEGMVEGQVGERVLEFPFVRTAQVHLWPVETGHR